MARLQDLTHPRLRSISASHGGSRNSGNDAKGEVARQVRDLGRRFQVLGRIGWVAKGMVYLLIGLVALQIALDHGSGGEEASGTGAVATLANRPFGKVLVGLLGAGLLLYVVWRLFTAFLPGDWTGNALLQRIGYTVSAVIYASLALTVLQVMRSGNTSDRDQEDRAVTGGVNALLDSTAGRWLVGLIGVAVLGIAVAFVIKATSKSFQDDIALPSDPRERQILVRSGEVGWTARGASMALIGFFLIRSAVTYDASEAGGIDGSLRQFTRYSWGQLVVGLIAVGFAMYGLFCVISARHQRLRAPRNGS